MTPPQRTVGATMRGPQGSTSSITIRRYIGTAGPLQRRVHFTSRRA
jgi:hypothetical protein